MISGDIALRALVAANGLVFVVARNRLKERMANPPDIQKVTEDKAQRYEIIAIEKYNWPDGWSYTEILGASTAQSKNPSYPLNHPMTRSGAQGQAFRLRIAGTMAGAEGLCLDR